MVFTNFSDPCLPIMANNRLFYKNENLFRRNATFDLFNNNNNNNTNNNNNNIISNNYNNSVRISGNATNSISSNGYYGYSSVNNFCADTQQQHTDQQQYQQISAATSYAKHQQDNQQHFIDSTNVQSCSYSYFKNKRQRNGDLNNNKMNNFKRCKLESK